MRFLFGMLLCVGLCPPIPAQSLEDEEQAIREMWARFQQYYAARDAEGVASIYAEDADRFANISQKAEGRTEVMEQYRADLERLEAGPASVDSSPAEITIRFLRPDVAILDGVVSPSSNVKVYFTVIVTNEDGQWWIAAGRPRGRIVD
jgi:uncharacterized protein (TIGR02246 family)